MILPPGKVAGTDSSRLNCIVPTEVKEETETMTIAPGRKALVTGGGAGFGFEIARRLAETGAQVALLDVDRERLEDAARRLGGGAVTVAADVRSPEQVRDAVEHAAGKLAGLDTLVNSAGVIHIKPMEEVTEADWDLTLDVNLKGAFLVSQAAAPHLRTSGRGRVVSIASDAARRGFASLQAYCASKFGLLGLTESLAVELAPDVTVNVVCPVGCPTTEMGKGVLAWKVSTSGKQPDQIVADAARGNPLGRNATEADIAAAVLFFCSEEASFLTGVALDVDGGAHLGFMPGV
jgi:NAD(P)-dependent dehydrogenase (short-subunit alcohol dehydrogenase family)